MNWDQVEGKWKQYKGKVKEKWGNLTDDDLDVIGGRYEQLIGKVQERYGVAREEAQRQVDQFTTSLFADDAVAAAQERKSRGAGRL